MRRCCQSFRLLIPTLLFIGSVPPVHAQVTVAPTFLHFGPDQPVATVNVINQTNQAQEVRAGFQFGYSVSDSLGNWTVRLEEAPSADVPDLTGWLKAFPPRFVLQPGARQVIRVLARPPADAEEGMYWTRFIVSSRARAASAGAQEGTISAHVALMVNQLFPVIYAKGAPRTGLAVQGTRTVTMNERTALLVDLARTGEAPFIGQALVNIYDAAGRLQQELGQDIAVYNTFTARFDLDPALPAGAYRADVTFVPERTGVPAGRLPAMEPVHLSSEFDVTPSELDQITRGDF